MPGLLRLFLVDCLFLDSPCRTDALALPGCFISSANPHGMIWPGVFVDRYFADDRSFRSYSRLAKRYAQYTATLLWEADVTDASSIVVIPNNGNSKHGSFCHEHFLPVMMCLKIRVRDCRAEHLRRMGVL